MAFSKVARGVTGVLLLICSTTFMNTAWYLHLRFDNWSYAQAIFISWSIALPEYLLQVPANRLAHKAHGGPFTAPQLKVIAEICSLTTFAIFSAVVLKEKLRWVDLGAFALILAGVLLSLLTKPAKSQLEGGPPSLPTTSAPPPPTAPPQPEAAAVPAAVDGGRRLMEVGSAAAVAAHAVGSLGVTADGAPVASNSDLTILNSNGAVHRQESSTSGLSRHSSGGHGRTSPALPETDVSGRQVKLD